MAKGFTDSKGVFHPTNNDNSTDGVSSDQVENQDENSQMNPNDVGKLKKRN